MAKPSAALHTPRPSAPRSSSSSTYSCSATRSSVGSTSSSAAAAASNLPVTAAPHRDSASNATIPLSPYAHHPLLPPSLPWLLYTSRRLSPSSSCADQVVAKCLVYDDDYFTLPSAAEDVPATQEDAPAPLLELPDPDVFSAAADDVLTASADSCVTEVPARADSTTDTEAAAAALPEEISHALAELRGAGGLSPRSKRLLAALAEAVALELATAAGTTTTTTRRARLRRASFWGKVRVAVLATTLAAVVTADVALAAYLYARRANERYGHAMLPPT